MAWSPPVCACGGGSVAFAQGGTVGFCSTCLDKRRGRVVRLPFQRSSATSRAAAESMRGTAAEQRARVATWYRAQPVGATREEAAIALSLPIQSICPRVRELVGDGDLVETNETRQTRAGKAASVLYWREAVDIGL